MDGPGAAHRGCPARAPLSQHVLPSPRCAFTHIAWRRSNYLLSLLVTAWSSLSSLTVVARRRPPHRACDGTAPSELAAHGAVARLSRHITMRS